MKLSVQNGILNIVDEKGTFAAGITAGVDFMGDFLNSLKLRSQGEWKIENNIALCDNTKIEFKEYKNGILLRTYYTVQQDITHAKNFRAVEFVSKIPKKVMITEPHTENSNPVGDMQAKIKVETPVWGGKYTSSDFIAVEADKTDFIFGFATYYEYFSTIDFQGEGVYAACHFLENKDIKKGAQLVSDWVYLSPCNEIQKALSEFAEVIADVENIKKTKHKIPVGHCSWYYYLEDVSEEDILENADWLKDNKKDFPVKYIQIDAGWEGCWGDWNPNEKFKDMAKISEKIIEKGFVPGIWFCPTGASDDSDVFKEHPEYFVKKKDGTPRKVFQNRYCFDFSQKAVCEHIKKIVKCFVDDWKIGYIKMDIITPTLVPGYYADESFNALKNYRRCLEVVREAAGEDVFLLSCTAPLLPSAGLVDGMRISGDVFDHWEGLPRIFGRILKRYWMHGTLFYNDADCLIVRTKDEEDDKCRRPCTRNKEELKTFVTAMAASGGALMFSDKMPLLKDWQLDLLKKCFPLNTVPAVPLDMNESFCPGVLDFGEYNGTRTVALINWGDTKRKFTLPYSENKLCFEFWDSEFYGLCKENSEIEIEPHCSKVFYLTEPKEKTVVGTDLSIVMRYDGRKADEKIYVAELINGEYKIKCE